MRGTETHSSPKVVSTTAAGLTDADGIKASIVTAVVASNYVGAALDGAVQAAGFGFPRYPTVASTANAATYNTTDPIVVTGTRSGVVSAVSLMLTAAGGGETITGATPLDTVTAIDVPAQLLAAVGAFTFGVVDMGCRCEVNAGALGQEIPYREVKVGGAGNLVVGFGDATTCTIPCVADEREPILVHRIYGTSTTTPITVYE
jgi:hypothetical protein